MQSPEQFFQNHIDKYYDVDGAYGVQCVDGFKLFTLEQYGIANYNCTNGWASGLWIFRKDKPYYEHFIEVPIEDIKNGDWLFWNNGAKDCPNSHVAMYYNGKFFGQNQYYYNKAFSLIDLSLDGVLGVLRPKIYIDKPKKYINIPGWIEERNVYFVESHQQYTTIKPKKFGGLSYLIYNIDGEFAEIETVNFGRCCVKITDATPITDEPLFTHGNY